MSDKITYKTAQLVMDPIPGVSGTGVAPSGGGSSGHGGTSGGTAGGGTISDKQKDNVRTMQNMMQALTTNLQFPEKAEKAFESSKAHNGKFKDAKEISMASKSFANTSAGGYGGQGDGIWGGNTKRALEAIQAFVQNAGVQQVILVTTRPAADDAATSAAQDNITNLARLFGSIGLETPPEARQTVADLREFDRVNGTVQMDDVNKPWGEVYGNKPVQMGDLKDLESFFMFILDLKFNPSNQMAVHASESFDLQKLAKMVLDGAIYSFAQQPPPPPPGQNGPPGPPPAPLPPGTPERDATPEDLAQGQGTSEGQSVPEGQGHYFNDIASFVSYFLSRSRSVYSQVSRARRSAMPHPIKEFNRGTNDADVQSAQTYQEMAKSVADSWYKISGDVKKVLVQRKLDTHPVVTLDVLLEAMRGSGGRGGRGGRGGDEHGRERGENGAFDQKMKSEGPIQRAIYLSQVLGPDSKIRSESQVELVELSSGGKLPNVIDQQMWDSGSWADLATRYVEGRNQEEKERNFVKWASALQTVLNEILQSWESVYGKDAGNDIMRRQTRMLDTWNSFIRAKIAEAERNGPRARPQTPQATPAPTAQPGQQTTIYEEGGGGGGIIPVPFGGGGYRGHGHGHGSSGGGHRGGGGRRR